MSEKLQKYDLGKLDSLPEPARKLYEILSKLPFNPFSSFQRELIKNYELIKPYLVSSLLAKLELQAQNSFLEDGRILALFTDKDKTAVAKINGESDYSKGQGLARVLSENNIPLILVSGAGFEDVNEDLSSSGLSFDGIACNVGTGFWVKNKQGELVENQNYTDNLSVFTENKRTIVERLQPTFSQFGEYNLRFQNERHGAVEGDFESFMANLYFDLPLNIENESEVLTQIYTAIQQALAGIGIDIKFNLCEEFKNNQNPESKTKRFCLDVLAANKDGALYNAVDAINILQPEARLFKITAGDSGNDISLFTSPNCDMFVIVGGADKVAESSKSYLQEGIESLGFELAKIEGTNIYEAKNPQTSNQKLVYIEDESSERVGPQSINQAIMDLQKINLNISNPI